MPSAFAFAKSPRPLTGFAPPSSPRAEIPVPDDDAIRCDACPVLCYIKPGRTGSCDRYANNDGKLVRVDSHVLLDRTLSQSGAVVPFLDPSREWDGSMIQGPE